MTKLTYRFKRTLFREGQLKPWVYKTFKNIKFIGFDKNGDHPSIIVSNYVDVKSRLPIIYRPMSVEKL